MYLRFIAVSKFRIEGVGALLIFYIEIFYFFVFVFAIVLGFSFSLFHNDFGFNTFLLHLT